MPLNYSKWDALEVSDDSDIEGHPNVDHKSLVRWKQRDIHERRESRRRRIAEYESIIALNDVLIPRVKEILKEVEDGGPAKYSAIVEKLERAPTDDKAPNQSVSFDGMLCDLLIKISDDLKAEDISKPDTDQLVAAIKGHLEKMEHTDDESRKALAEEIAEQKKKITSDDIHDGFSATSVTKEEPAPAPKAKKKATATTKTQETQIEVLNPGAVVSASAEEAITSEQDDDENSERIPDLTGALLDFSRIRVGNFEQSYKFIQAHPREVIREGAYDELVIAGFRAAMKGQKKYSKQCVHQALVIQYCDKLGKDGVGLFFKRITSGDPRSKMAFDQDFESTYKMLVERAVVAAEEDQQTARERIQLVAEDPTQTITFNVPEGPPPETIKLEGPGTEHLNPEEVREALLRRWEIFENFDEELKVALTGGKLEDVNDVLGDMDVSKAEDVVKLLEIAGILSFSRSGIVDATGRGVEGDTDTANASTQEEIAAA